ncbi:hypothetical protein C8R42DRAFT_646970 [Lentinula raphanica]|nr:hypothetical protein C8R42DRAFT_646970 [Lentinula raphanica]
MLEEQRKNHRQANQSLLMPLAQKRKQRECPSSSPKKKQKLNVKRKETGFQVIHSSFVLSLSPVFASNPRSGVEELLDSMIMRYIPALDAVVLSHSNITFNQDTAAIQADSPFLICNISFDATVWRPLVGMKLATSSSTLTAPVGKLSLCSPDHISLLVHKTFNVSIPRHHIPTHEWEFEYGPAENDPEFGSGAQAINVGIDPGEGEGEGSGRWIHRLTASSIGGQDGYVEFTVIGYHSLTVANEMLSLIGSLQLDPFSEAHVPSNSSRKIGRKDNHNDEEEEDAVDTLLNGVDIDEGDSDGLVKDGFTALIRKQHDASAELAQQAGTAEKKTNLEDEKKKKKRKMSAKHGESGEWKKAVQAAEMRRKEEGKEKDRAVADLGKTLSAEKKRREMVESQMKEAKAKHEFETDKLKAGMGKVKVKSELTTANDAKRQLQLSLDGAISEADSTEEALLARLGDHRVLLGRLGEQYGLYALIHYPRLTSELTEAERFQEAYYSTLAEQLEGERVGGRRGSASEYIPALDAVVLSHSNITFDEEAAASIQADCPFLVYKISFDATVWSPLVEMKLDHISLLVHKTFNEWEFEYGPAENDPEFGAGAGAEGMGMGMGLGIEPGEGEGSGRWIHRVTASSIGGEDGYVEFTAHVPSNSARKIGREDNIITGKKKKSLQDAVDTLLDGVDIDEGDGEELVKDGFKALNKKQHDASAELARQATAEKKKRWTRSRRKRRKSGRWKRS